MCTVSSQRSFFEDELFESELCALLAKDAHHHFYLDAVV